VSSKQNQTEEYKVPVLAQNGNDVEIRRVRERRIRRFEKLHAAQKKFVSSLQA
jgi:hypothetical protein